MAKKIKSIRRFHSEYRNFSFTEMAPEAEEEYLELVIDMDENGNVSSESKYDQEGELEEKNSYMYDSNGKVTEHVLLYAVDDVTERRMMQRDEKGNLLTEQKFYGDDSGEKIEYTYDADFNIVAIKRYDEEGDFSEREEITYDSQKSLKERSAYNKDGKLIRKVTFQSGEQKTASETELDEKGNVVTKTEIFFNAEGKEQKMLQTNHQGKLISATENHYDEKGNLVRRDHKDFFSKTVHYAYDEQNRLISQDMYDASGLLLRKNTYAYDEDGNLIAEQTYEIDTTRGGRDKHFGARYEYSFVD